MFDDDTADWGFPFHAEPLEQAQWYFDVLKDTIHAAYAVDDVPKRRVMSLRPGERVEFITIPGMADLVRIALWVGFHHHHGFSLVCPQRTSPVLLGLTDRGDRPLCPACKAGLTVRISKYLPVVPVNYFQPNRGWMSRSDGRAVLLRMPVEVCLEQEADLSSGNQLWVLARANTDYGRYSLAPLGRRKLSESDLKKVGRLFPITDARFDLDDLQAIANNAFNSPRPGRARELLKKLPSSTLVPLFHGSKKPRVNGWPEWSRDDSENNEDLLDQGNIALLNEPIASIDVDSNPGLAEFEHLNSWTRQAMHSRGRRGGHYHFLPAGDGWPTGVVPMIAADGKPWGELRMSGSLTVISGFHPSGSEYHLERLGMLPELGVDEFILPDGVSSKSRHQNQRVETFRGPKQRGDGECHLDLGAIEGLRETNKGLVGRCPACAACGGDRKAEHLLIYPDGAYHCIVECDPKDIFSLVGNHKTKARRGRQTVWRAIVRNVQRPQPH